MGTRRSRPPWRLDRSGWGEEGVPRILETYPAAQYCAWRPPEKRGRDNPGKSAKPATLVDVLALAKDASPVWPGLPSPMATPKVVQLLEANPHARDSLVAAITSAMAARDGKNVHPMSVDGGKGFGEAAAAEGVIWLHDPHFANRPIGHGSDERGRSR